jgi:transcriptional regulator with XRE-family HTH domain
MNVARKDAGVGAKLQELREQAGLTGREVAARMRVHESLIRHLERGTTNPGFTKVLRYCRAIGVRIHIGLDDRPRSSVQVECEPVDDVVRRLVKRANGDPVVVERVCRDLYGTLLDRFTRQAIRDGDPQREWHSELMAAFLNDLANFAEDNAEDLRA